jgi:O-antigen/teichoic acid export membrane protein
MTALRLGAWVSVVREVFLVAGKPAYSILGLVQSTVGILEYAAVGLSPAIIHLTAKALANNRQEAVSNHHSPIPAVRAVYANGIAMAVLTAIGGGIFLAILLPALRVLVPHMQHAPTDARGLASMYEFMLFVGVATLLKMVSDAPAAVLQTRDRIYLDNILQSIHEIIWAAGTAIGIHMIGLPWQRATGFALITGAGILLLLRAIFSHRYGSGIFEKWWQKVDMKVVRQLLVFGAMVVAAQMADFLYSPTNNLIIGYTIDLNDAVADYAAAVQIDGGMLLVASALAMVLLPRAALVHAEGRSAEVRKFYVNGTLLTAGLLLAAAPVVWLLAPHVFQLLFHNSMPVTCSILPLVLIHTVIGGSSAVGRSILLAIGKVRAFTISVVVGGIANIVLSLIFVLCTNLGLKGIVLGTIIAVTGRCAIWLPWYVLRVLRTEQITPTSETEINLLRDTMPPPPMD